MPVDHDSDDTQPKRNGETVSRRIYIHAVWKPAGGGSHAPKISGGITIDRHTGHLAPRGLNRPDQRYSQPASTLITNRQARAVAEYANSVVLLGELNRYEVRAVSGNNYDVGRLVDNCDCPDWLRLTESGYNTVLCKHMYIVNLAKADPVFSAGLWYSTAKLAEVLTCEERTARAFCHSGMIQATMKHKVWMIDPNSAFNVAAIAAYLAKIIHG